MAAGGLSRVLDRVAGACLRSGRSTSDVSVVAVSKGRSLEDITDIYDMGHRDFGENRADELVRKALELPDDITWHFVGSIQTRKTRLIIPHVRWIHSVDRPKLAETIGRTQMSHARPRCFLQVNVAGEEQKHGVGAAEATDLLESAAGAGLDVAGLMLIPPLPETPEDSRPWYRELVSLRDELATPEHPLAELSMGMTEDFEVAVEEGATVVRVGRAIFRD